MNRATQLLQQPREPADLRGWLGTRTQPERALLARLWVLPTELASEPEALADAMLRPEQVELVLGRLVPAEHAALQLVQSNGGAVRAPVLEREFGDIRDTRSFTNPRAYLQALQQTASPTERLYVLALLRPQWRGERFYAIPTDLLPLLPPPPPRERTLEFATAAEPQRVVAHDQHQIESNLLVLMTLGQDDQLEVIPSGGMSKASLLRLARRWTPGEKLQGLTREERWPYVHFLHRVGVGAGLVRVGADARLRPTREAIQWMRAPAAERARTLLDGWVESTWDELTTLLGMKLQRAYGRNLAAARRAVLALLGQVPAGEWIDLGAFVAAIKRSEPDFARPHGNYDTWGIINHMRQPLDGFEFWDAVEGEQLRAIIDTSLAWIGLVDVGVYGEEVQSFRVNPLGAALLHGHPPPAEPPAEPLVVQPNFELLATQRASLYAQFQLGRIAEASGGDSPVYKLTRRSLQTALERGARYDDMIGFLEEASGRPLPQNVSATLRDWAGQHGQVVLRRGTLLEAQDAPLLEQIRRDRRVRLPQVERLTDTSWLVREGDAPALAERLRKAGYGLSGDGALPDQPFSERDLTVLFAALESYEALCEALGLDGDVSDAMRQRLARLLPEKSLNHAYRLSHDVTKRLRERLDHG